MLRLSQTPPPLALLPLLLLALGGCAEPLQSGGVEVVGDAMTRLEELCRFRRGALADELCGGGDLALADVGSLELAFARPAGAPLPRALRIELAPTDGGEVLALDSSDAATLESFELKPSAPPPLLSCPRGPTWSRRCGTGAPRAQAIPVLVTAGALTRLTLALGETPTPTPQPEPPGQPGGSKRTAFCVETCKMTPDCVPQREPGVAISRPTAPGFGTVWWQAIPSAGSHVTSPR